MFLDSFTCSIHLYRFYHNVYPSHVLFFKFLPLVILQKKFFAQFLFSCKFSYLDQFYSFTCTIHLYRFTTMFIRHMCNFLSFSPQYFYRKNFCAVFIFLQIQLFRPILQFHTCNSFMLFFTTMFIGHTCTFFKILPLYFLQK